ncbi:hypothetical protein TrLO_g5398 [Triparma laevis f. longispina]|uniref:CCHC-type domain-containing protein n=1 Tax=Triparma laevis f. longispina TaxID=1714387 RepID=A0A9W7KWT9_9STRA|nr:hypothetical protein TrLO_g5398 [Triparma laevis f. longispina]
MPRSSTKRKLALAPLPTVTGTPVKPSPKPAKDEEEELPDVPSPLSSPTKKLKTSPKKPSKSPSKSNTIANFFSPQTPKDKPSFGAASTKVTPSPEGKRQQRKLEVEEIKKEKKVKRKTKAKTAVPLSTSNPNSEKAPHVPTYIHANIGYSVETSSSILSLSIPKRKVFTLIRSTHELPLDFETRKYGPKSGQSFEQRVLGCYDIGMLEDFRIGEKFDACVECGGKGHRRVECPTLL